MAGLFECEFCSVECTGAEVARGFVGDAELAAEAGPGGTGARLRCRLSSQAWEHVLGINPDGFANLPRAQRAACSARAAGVRHRWLLCSPNDAVQGGPAAPWAALAAPLGPAAPPAGQ